MKANARRIVACVNACAGIDNVYLGSQENLAAYARRMTIQRDELLAALKDVLPWVVSQRVACHGMKCREAVCESCSGEESAEESVGLACIAVANAQQTIAKVEVKND